MTTLGLDQKRPRAHLLYLRNKLLLLTFAIICVHLIFLFSNAQYSSNTGRLGCKNRKIYGQECDTNNLKALFHLSQESTRKVAESIFILSQCSKVYFNEKLKCTAISQLL